MKIAVYEVREDERRLLDRISAELFIELKLTSDVPTTVNSDLVDGCDGVSFLGQGRIDETLLSIYKNKGVRFISTRTVGTDHIDLAAAARLGIRVCNAEYAPNGVADFTVMLMLMCLRQYKQALWRGQVNDFSLAGLQGREMKDLTIGVIGAGRIGRQVIKNLSGFGCRILTVGRYRDSETEKIAEYVDEDTLYSESDVITLHVPLTEKNYHMINKQTLSKMKNGVVLINCSRGELADIECLVEGIESGKIGALGIDTSEGEEGIIHADHRVDILANRSWFYLHQFRNVVMTPHMAFYTDAAVESMVKCGIEGIFRMANGIPCSTEIIS